MKIRIFAAIISLILYTAPSLGMLSPEKMALARYNLKQEILNHPQFLECKHLHKELLINPKNQKLSNQLMTLKEKIELETKEILIKKGFENLYQECCREEQSKNS